MSGRDIVSEQWYGIELWIPEKAVWWSSGTRFDTVEEAQRRAAEVDREHRITLFILTREVVSSDLASAS